MHISTQFAEITNKSHWIFDMDGTLTIHMHDAYTLRSALKLPLDSPVLEGIAKLPPAQAKAKYQQLCEIELDIAHQAEPQAGVFTLLDCLIAQNIPMAILTRNSRVNANATLMAAGLAEYFAQSQIITREDTEPKPSPAGIERLCRAWGIDKSQTLIIGDTIHDLQTAINAEITSVYIDPSGEFPLRDKATYCIKTLAELLS